MNSLPFSEAMSGEGNPKDTVCGLCGVAGSQLDDARLRRSIRTLDHRGPDDQGSVSLAGPVYFGHTRLRIIDLSPAGHQPMRNEDDTVWIIYNGEVYNFTELGETLRRAGHRFRSRSDTEVILHGYEEWGIDGLLERLNGMFAFAIYDARHTPHAPRLHLARDRLGIKPLYYTLRDGMCAFASEIKALLALDLCPREVNWQAIYDYFSFLYVPCPQTAFRGILQIPPGHYLTYRVDGPPEGRATLGRYWTPLPGGPDGPHEGASFAELQRELRQILEDSVARQLISDVPLGVFLSGGIDSTILTGLAARATSDRLRTFTVLFEGEGIAPYDETGYARRVSRYYNTDHTELVVDLSSPQRLLELVSCFDQPFANPTFYLSYLISQKTREQVTVALSGAGGDELFGGYPRYRVLPYSRLLGAVPQGVGRRVSDLLRFVPENYDTQALRRMKLLARGIGREFPEQYLRWTYYFGDEEKQTLLAPLLARVGHPAPSVRILERYLEEAGGVHDLPTRVQYLDLNTFLADNILEYTDKSSMAVSLEVRVPFLDHRLVELSARTSWEHKIRNGTSKYILRETFRDLIPPENLKAPKRGFCPPLPVWMERSLDRYFDEWMTRDEVRRQGIFEWGEVQRLREDHRRRRRDNSMELFGIIMFDVWYRTYILQHLPVASGPCGV